uniref:Secreted protein n=1 Tax=Anguilla anguilla TaxID=7936 RepID=A0A0E9QQ69_ANGAN
MWMKSVLLLESTMRAWARFPANCVGYSSNRPICGDSQSRKADCGLYSSTFKMVTFAFVSGLMFPILNVKWTFFKHLEPLHFIDVSNIFVRS